MNYLISTIDLIFELKSKVELGELSYEVYASKTYLLAEFLTDELNVSMFIPAIFKNGKWEVLQEPICNGVGDEQYYGSRMDEYKKAKDNVLFEGFNVSDFDLTSNSGIFNCVKLGLNGFNLTIQDLLIYKLILTKTGLENSGLINV